MKGIVWSLLVMVVAFCIFTITYDDFEREMASRKIEKIREQTSTVEQAPTPVTADYTLTAAQLRAAYKSDKYIGKTVIVSGRVQYIDKSESPVITFSVNELNGVYCEPTTGQKHAFRRLSRGEYVTVRGTVTSPAGTIPWIEHCTIVKPVWN